MSKPFEPVDIKIIKERWESNAPLIEIHSQFIGRDGLTVTGWAKEAGITVDSLYKILRGQTAVREQTLSRVYRAAGRLLFQGVANQSH
jgi:predicted transcriptional regulator